MILQIYRNVNIMVSNYFSPYLPLMGSLNNPICGVKYVKNGVIINFMHRNYIYETINYTIKKYKEVSLRNFPARKMCFKIFVHFR